MEEILGEFWTIFLRRSRPMKGLSTIALDKLTGKTKWSGPDFTPLIPSTRETGIANIEVLKLKRIARNV
jgi:hypothetical protein